ncbi:O-antigen polysaccharide polymerase Wzy [Micromonospora sp. NPDC003197]
MGLAIAVVLFGVVAVKADALGSSPRLAASVATAVACFGIAVLTLSLPGRRITLGSVYFLIFALFHVGLCPYIAVGQVPRLLVEASPVNSAWYHSPMLAPALTAIILGMLALLIGYLGIVSIVGWQHTIAVRSVVADRAGQPGLEIVGFGMLATGVLLWFVFAATQGSTFFLTQSYESFRTATAGKPLPYLYLFIGLGMGLLGLGRWTRLHRWGLVIFAVFAIPAGIIGVRNMLFIPLAAWLVAAASRRTIRLRPWLVPALLVGLAAGSLARQIRQTGLSGAQSDSVTINPLDGLAELGTTLRTMVVAYQWHAEWNEPFVGWGTYWAPLERIVVGRLFGAAVTPTFLDIRVFSATVFDRVGAIGGSPAAEAYRAAGLVGVVVVMLLIGALIAWIDLRPAGSILGSATGMIGYILLVWIRNDFTPVVVQCLAAGAAMALVMLVDRYRTARRNLTGTPLSASEAGAVRPRGGADVPGEMVPQGFR